MCKENWVNCLKDRVKVEKQPADCIALICVAIGLLIVVIFGCPFYELFGIACPCCGVTRAWLCLLRGDVVGAFRYHGLFPVLPLLVALYVLNGKIPCKWKKTSDVVLAIGAVAVVLYGILRWCGLIAMP